MWCDDAAVNEYNRYCPIQMGSDVIADRWTPLIVRELVMGNTRFNDIARGLPGISRSLLVRRLNHLERMGVLDRFPSPSGKGSEYVITPAGRDLERVLIAMGQWSVRWLYQELRPRDIDAVTLMWWMHRRIDSSRLPSGRVIVQFDHTAPVRVALWLVFERGDVSLCTQYPGADADVVVSSPTPVLAGVFSGVDTWDRAVASGAMTVAGPPRLTRALPKWFLWSPFVDDVRQAEAARESHERALAHAN
jgi:DNA-binding HxlR family transcriptional regulator